MQLTLTVMFPSAGRLNANQLVNKIKEVPYEQLSQISHVEIISDDTSIIDLDNVKSLGVKFTGKTFTTGLLRGQALRRAVELCSGDLVLVLDSEVGFVFEDTAKLLQPILSNTSEVSYAKPQRGAESFVNYINLPTTAKAYKASLLKNLRLVADGEDIDVELMARALSSRARSAEIVTRYEGSANAKISLLGLIWAMVRFRVIDTQPYKPGLNQSLNALDTFGSIVYAPILHKAISIALKNQPKTKGLNILEIGSGTGTLTKELLPLGSVTATDISDEFVDTLKTRFSGRTDINIFHWDASLPYPLDVRQKFDLIVCFNVLEHIERDIDALKIWRQLLARDGSLIVLVPAFQMLYCPIDKALGHFRRYTLANLREKIHASGMVLRGSFYGNVLGLAGWLVSGVILRKSSLSSGQIRLFVILKTLTMPLEHLLSRVIGLSVITVSKVDSTNS